MMPNVNREHITEALALCVPEARAAWLYGSAARGELHAHSDIDLAVLLPKSSKMAHLDMFSAAQALAARLGRDVDLVNVKSVSPVLQKEIFEQGQCLFANDPIEIAETELFAMSQYRAYNERFASEFAHIAQSGKILA